MDETAIVETAEPILPEPPEDPPVSIPTIEIIGTSTSAVTVEITPDDEDKTEDVNDSQNENSTNTEVKLPDQSQVLGSVPVPNIVADIKDNESSLDVSKMDESSVETEHKDYKTMSREMRSLINSAKDSKIISEFTQIKTKMRKPRKDQDTSTTSLNVSAEVERSQGSRRNSDNSLVSNSSDVSDKAAQRRSMRSLNPEFVNKQKRFLSSLSGRPRRDDVDVLQGTSDSDSGDDERSLSTDHSATAGTPKVDQAENETTRKLRSDKYCWRCHWEIETQPDVPPPPQCSVCPRSYHPKCLPGGSKATGCDSPNWVCPECLNILHAEDSESRSPSMQRTSLNTLCTLLNYALVRMRLVNGAEEFLHPVDVAACSDYREHVAHPMDLGRMQQNIADGVYGSTEAFLADSMWILHNCLVYNSPVRSRLTVAARALVRVCRIEMGEIEACPECYAAAHARRPTWFTDVCSTPHMLLWAKLKGFPYWPAKAMSVNDVGMVDVRFFGDHDRAWVPAKYCYLYSQKDPNNTRFQRNDIMLSVKEAEQHIKSIVRKFGSFVHATPRTIFEPARIGEQLKMMIPGYQGALPAPRFLKESVSNTSSPATKAKRPRSYSKGSKDSILDGYGTDEEEPVCSRKMPDGAEIARDDDNGSTNTSLREKSMELDVVNCYKSPRIRKRRRSFLEEASEFAILEPNKKITRTRSQDTADKEVDSKKSNPDKDEISENNDNGNTSLTKSSVVKDDEKMLNEDCNKSKCSETNKTNNTVVIIKHSKKLSPKQDSKAQSCMETIDITDDSDPKTKQKARKSVTPDSKTSPNKGTESRLPTITSVCTLSGEEAAAFTDKSGSSGASTPVALTVVEPNALSSIFKVSQRKPAASMKDAVAKLQALRDADGPPSVSTTPASTSPASASSAAGVLQVDIEIKAEPMDYDDVEKSAEKNDLLSSLNLRPTATVGGTEAYEPWREGTKVTRAADLRSVRKATVKSSVTPRARKTFPQPQRGSPKSDDSRVDLNGKNSMVYIPIQPSATQPPPRVVAKPTRSVATVVSSPSSTASIQRTTNTPLSTAAANTMMTTSASSGTSAVTPAPPVTPSGGGLSVVPMSVLSRSPAPAPAPPPSAASSSVASSTAPPQPATTQPLVLSSLNGHWTLCMPSMVNMETRTTPLVNGMSESGAGGESGAGDPAGGPATLTPVSSGTGPSTEPPPLRARPGHPLDPATPIGPLPVPSTAGPVSLQLNQCAVKLADYFRHLVSESLQLLDDPAATTAALRLQLEQAEWRHKQELAELKHNIDVQMLEMRASLERDKATAIAEARRVAEIELNSSVNHAKSKQWCANCRQEAQFYCCWNTSYCDYPCQQAHWSQHLPVCTQQQKQKSRSEATTSGDDVTVRSVVSGRQTAALGAGAGPSGGGASPRSLAPNMLMNLQTGGGLASTGYKVRPAFTQPAYIINKTLINSDESTTVMTPGGYLIVGAGNSGRPAVVSHSGAL